MIVIITKEDLCIIGHISHLYHPGYLYSFRKEFLTEKIWRSLRLLPAFRNSNSILLLNNDQEHQLTGIFEKISSEQQSGYIFSEDLQRIYLVELIHFINKLPLQKGTLALSSANK